MLASKTELPELKRVIVAYESEVVMEDNLDSALRKLFLGVGSPQNASKLDLTSQAVHKYEVLRYKMEKNDWVGVGQAMSELQDIIERMKSSE